MIEQAEQIIESNFMQQWQATPIDSDNVPYRSKHGTPFVRLQIEWADNQAIGPWRERGTGVVLVSIFTPAMNGTRLSAQFADQVRAVFKGMKQKYLKFKPARVNRVGEIDGWYQRNVVVPFTYDEC